MGTAPGDARFSNATSRKFAKKRMGFLIVVPLLGPLSKAYGSSSSLAIPVAQYV